MRLTHRKQRLTAQVAQLLTLLLKGRGQFTAEQVAAIDAAAKRAGGFFSGATQDYIDQLQAGALGGGTDTLNALNTLIAQGELKPVAPDYPNNTR
jgi:hypothetical protein